MTPLTRPAVYRVDEVAAKTGMSRKDVVRKARDEHWLDAKYSRERGRWEFPRPRVDRFLNERAAAAEAVTRG